MAQNGIVRGMVKASDGEAVGGVTVTLTDSAGVVVTRGVTAADGAYWISGVAPGSGYSLDFRRLGFLDLVRDSLTVEPRDTLVVNVELSSDPVLVDSLVVQVPGGSPFAQRVRAPVGAAEIRNTSGMISGGDILRVLRPNAIASRVAECGDIDLKVFINGVREDRPSDTLVLIPQENASGERERVGALIAELPVPLQSLVGLPTGLGSPVGEEISQYRLGTHKQANLYAAWLALKRVRAQQIERAAFLSCTDHTIPGRMRNAIWIVLKPGRAEDGW